MWYSHLITIPFVFKAWSKDQVPHRLHAKYGAEEKAAGGVTGFSQRRTCQVACSRYRAGSYGHHFFYQLYLTKFSFGQQYCKYSSLGTVAAFNFLPCSSFVIRASLLSQKYDGTDGIWVHLSSPMLCSTQIEVMEDLITQGMLWHWTIAFVVLLSAYILQWSHKIVI